MHTLSITDDAGNVILQMNIRAVPLESAVPAILSALAALPEPKTPRKPRADKGKPRATEATAQ